jgi:hypothetical protein
MLKFGTDNNSIENWKAPTTSIIKSNHGRSIINAKSLCDLE